MKGIYLGACRAYHPKFDLDYNDIIKSSKHINIICDMLTVDLAAYDYLIATPPCNYWSRCNYRRDISSYAINTKDLLLDVLKKFVLSCKPFIVENVRSSKLFKKFGIFKFCNDNGIFIYFYGRHTYFTNVMINFNGVIQRQDFLNGGVRIKYHDDYSKYNQGGFNVHNVIDYWIEYTIANYL